jgi:uncharacterized protein (UPF0276 family)
MSHPFEAIGVGYKPVHFPHLQSCPAGVGWLEIHAENFFGAGGAPLAQLAALRADYPVSVHGVGLSIGGSQLPDATHLQNLKDLLERVEPFLFSEHLAWSGHGGVYLNDLLPLPYNQQTLAKVCRHIDHVQTKLGRQMLLENLSSYLGFAETDMSETEFLREIVSRTGCGLLLDVNNVHVSCTNQGWSADAYLADFPYHAVGEIHLAGFFRDRDADGFEVLIDNHGAAVDVAVWDLYGETLRHIGRCPTLIEWDTDIPDWPELYAEVNKARELLQGLPVPDKADQTREAVAERMVP